MKRMIVGSKVSDLERRLEKAKREERFLPLIDKIISEYTNVTKGAGGKPWLHRIYVREDINCILIELKINLDAWGALLPN